MRNFIQRVGFVILIVGASFANSDSLIIPTVTTGVGALMMLYSSEGEI